MIALLVVTDGRQHCLERTTISAAASLLGPVTRVVVIDDSGDQDYQRWLDQITEHSLLPFHCRVTIDHHHQRAGFAAAIRTGWSHLYDGAERYVFHLEDDFTFNRPVHLEPMIQVLDENPNLVQLALRRQPWNAEERAAGGIVEQHPEDYTDRSDAHGHEWLEHRRFFTTNPSLYRTDLCALGWPQVDRSEGVFTHQLLADPDITFGFWGARHSGEWVRHIGDERVGVGY